RRQVKLGETVFRSDLVANASKVDGDIGQQVYRQIKGAQAEATRGKIGEFYRQLLRIGSVGKIVCQLADVAFCICRAQEIADRKVVVSSRKTQIGFGQIENRKAVGGFSRIALHEGTRHRGRNRIDMDC